MFLASQFTKAEQQLHTSVQCSTLVLIPSHYHQYMYAASNNRGKCCCLRCWRKSKLLARQQYMAALSDNHSFFEGLPSTHNWLLHLMGWFLIPAVVRASWKLNAPTVNVNPINVVDSSLYLKNTKDGLKLSHNHKPYFQIQGQMECVCNHILMSYVGPPTKWILNTLSETMNILKAKVWLLTLDPLFFFMLFMELRSIF